MSRKIREWLMKLNLYPQTSHEEPRKKVEKKVV